MLYNKKRLPNAIYSGSFDPIHAGHIAIIKKILPLFTTIYIVVAINLDKHNENSLAQRLTLVSACIKKKHFSNVKVIAYDGFVIDLAKELKVDYLIRSVRNVQDFKQEQLIAAINKKLNPQIETIIFFADESYQNISSSKIKSQIKQYQDFFVNRRIKK